MNQPRPCLGKGDLFFPKKTETDKIESAMKLCLDCIFLTECDEYRRISNSEYGIWAGRYYDGA